MIGRFRKKIDWMKVFFPKRSFETPFFYRLLEGLTTFSMPLGFLIGGGKPASMLFLFYLLHSLASFSFHLFPSAHTYFLDISLIDLLCMERRYMTSHNLWVYTLYLVSMLAEDTKTHWGVVLRIGLGIASTWTGSVYYLCMVMIMFLTFLQSCHYAEKNDVAKTTLTCCLFHLYLGCVSYMETAYYDWDQNTEHFFRYGAYLVFVFLHIHLLVSLKHLHDVLTTFVCYTPTTSSQDNVVKRWVFILLSPITIMAYYFFLYPRMGYVAFLDAFLMLASVGYWVCPVDGWRRRADMALVGVSMFHKYYLASILSWKTVLASASTHWSLYSLSWLSHCLGYEDAAMSFWVGLHLCAHLINLYLYFHIGSDNKNEIPKEYLFS